ERVQIAQNELDQNLEFIHTQQTELHQLLDGLEQHVFKLAEETELSPSDKEREKGYQLAEDVNVQLDQMANTLKELVNTLNSENQYQSDDNNVCNSFKFIF